jgi:hypothetical protein
MGINQKVDMFRIMGAKFSTVRERNHKYCEKKIRMEPLALIRNGNYVYKLVIFDVYINR